MKKIFTVFVILSVLFCSSCSVNTKYLTLNKTFTPDENGVYKDLGNYLIELNYQEADFDAAKVYLENKLNANSAAAVGAGACTTCSKLNDKKEVLIGRNLDNEVSLYPAFLIHTSFGKYPTFSIRYNYHDTYTYEDFKETGHLDKDYMNYIPFCVTDAMNSEGLYVEANVREPDKYFLNTGTNPGKEKVRVSMLVQLIAMNCATIEDALNYLRNEINIVSVPYVDVRTPTQYGYCIGDATGNFGVIEIARNEVRFIPYQPAQGNFYLSPTWNAMDSMGSGYGRMERVMDGLDKVNTLEDMMEQMKKPMWCQEILYMDNVYQDEDGTTRFEDNEGNPSIDWRSDLANILHVDPETGHVVSKEAGENLFVNSNPKWMMNEDNFEEMYSGISSLIKGLGWKEKLIEYYKGNELPLREDGGVFTTGVSYSVNCAQKKMLIKFWEKEDLTYEIRMK